MPYVIESLHLKRMKEYKNTAPTFHMLCENKNFTEGDRFVIVEVSNALETGMQKHRGHNEFDKAKSIVFDLLHANQFDDAFFFLYDCQDRKTYHCTLKTERVKTTKRISNGFTSVTKL